MRCVAICLWEKITPFNLLIGKRLSRRQTGCFLLANLASDGLDDFVNPRFKARGFPLGEKVRTGHVDFHFRNLVIAIVTFLHTKKDLTRDDLVMKRIELADLVFYKFEQARISVKMDGVDLHLRGCEGLILRPNVQRTVLMQLLQP